MTRLNCSVSSCVANESNLCCYDSILVGCTCSGSAGTKDDTCCESFAEKTASATNSTSSSNPSANTQVKCTVHDCQYNHSDSCRADAVSVQGGTTSSHHSTRCGTYKIR